MNYYTAPALKASTPEAIISKICDQYGVNPEYMVIRKRTKELVFPRHLAMYVIKKRTGLPVTAIGKIFNRDHTTVIHAVRMIENYIETDSLGKRAEILEVIHNF